MTEMLERKEYYGKNGQYIAWKDSSSKTDEIGIFDRLPASLADRFLHVYSLTDGFPQKVRIFPENDSVKLVDQKKGLDLVLNAENNLLKQRETGGLQGALAVRKHYQLSYIRKQLEKSEKDFNNLAVILSIPREPGTGVYLLLPTYHGNGPSLRSMEAIRIVPRVPEEAAKELVMGLVRAEGRFGKISQANRDLEATSYGTLISIRAFELPNDALQLVGSPPTLEYNLSGGK